MPVLHWDAPGERFFETGISHGVLYPGTKSGVSWNGLTTLTESPSGGELNFQYGDNVKYANILSPDEFSGTIEAFSYPSEFAECDGSASPFAGLYFGQQPRKSFGLSYQTLIGNDVAGTDFGYVIHLIYNATAGVAEKAHETVNDSPSALSFSWEFTANPVSVGGIYKPTAHLSINSTKIDSAALSSIRTILYGSATTSPRLPLPSEVIDLTFSNANRRELQYNTASDLYFLYENGISDITADTDEGYFSISSPSRLSGDTSVGFYQLGS